jgi:hypothetical protein
MTPLTFRPGLSRHDTFFSITIGILEGVEPVSERDLGSGRRTADRAGDRMIISRVSSGGLGVVQGLRLSTRSRLLNQYPY